MFNSVRNNPNFSIREDFSNYRLGTEFVGLSGWSVFFAAGGGARIAYDQNLNIKCLITSGVGSWAWMLDFNKKSKGLPLDLTVRGGFSERIDIIWNALGDSFSESLPQKSYMFQYQLGGNWMLQDNNNSTYPTLMAGTDPVTINHRDATYRVAHGLDGMVSLYVDGRLLGRTYNTIYTSGYVGFGHLANEPNSFSLLKTQ